MFLFGGGVTAKVLPSQGYGEFITRMPILFICIDGHTHYPSLSVRG